MRRGTTGALELLANVCGPWAPVVVTGGLAGWPGEVGATAVVVGFAGVVAGAVAGVVSAVLPGHQVV